LEIQTNGNKKSFWVLKKDNRSRFDRVISIGRYERADFFAGLEDKLKSRHKEEQ
jgi:hypothetical protein